VRLGVRSPGLWAVRDARPSAAAALVKETCVGSSVELPFRLMPRLAGRGMPKECDDQWFPGRMRGLGNIPCFSAIANGFRCVDLQKV